MEHVVFANHRIMATNSRTGTQSTQFNLNQEFKIKHKQSVLPALCKCYWQSFISVISLNLCLVLLAFVNPLLLQLFITYAAEDPSVRDRWKGYFIAYCFLITGLAITIVSSQYYFKTLVIGLQIRMTLTSIIYKKALVLAISSKKERTTGQIVNLMAVDVNRFAEVLPFVNLTWTIPLRLFIAIGFLTNILGYSVWVGLLVLILILPLQIFCATCHKKFSAAQMRYKDERMKLLMEVLNGFKAIRLYCWEAFFELQIKKKREKEISYLKKLSYLLAAMTFFWLSTPYLMAFGSFTCFVLVNASNQLTPHIAFVALSLFNLLQIPLALFPQMVAALVQASVSLKRINAFLNSDEMDEDAVTHDTTEADVIVIENGAFAWDCELVLSNINSRIAPGTLVAITGAVGSGKTSLLSALLGEIPRICGRVNVKGTIAYVPQQAWILNGTVRDNILFGLPYDKSRYEKVVEACSLLEDFQQFPAGDWTEIAGKGMNLSGGQKLRINLARAVYFDADIYLLDDPLSAVDYHVGNFIFEQVISQHGILKNKTRLVVTQNISTLHCYPRIIVLSDGKISEDGSFNQLLSNRGAFSKYLLQYLTDITSQAGGVKKGMQPTDSSLRDSVSSASTINQKLSESQNQSSFVMHSIAEEPGTTESVSASTEKTREEEYTETGKVKCKVYRDYLVAMGPRMVVVIFLLYCLYQIFMSGGNIWLAKFTDHHSQDVMVFLIVYALLGVGQLLSVGTAVLLLYLGGMIASKTLHNDMLHNILRVPIQFFSITPYGRVINRFSKDVDALDTILPISLQSFVGLAFMVAGSLIIIAIILPLFISFVVILLILYFIIQRYYLNISRQLKRLESINRSPLYSHFEESLAGVSSIRAFGVQGRFISENHKRMERCIVCIHTSFICDRWLQLRLELVGDILIFVTVLCAVINLGNVETGDVGLTVTYALTLTFNLNMLVRNASMVETNIVGAERIKEYIDIPREAAWHLDVEGVESKWPEKGEIVFENYKFCYRPGLDYVLNDISFTINGGEKVGIVGRTGAGKSSLTMALFRLFEAADGAIYIDGVDIATIGLSTLRSRLTIIPQDTVLLSGSLRMNLDPGYQHSDKKLRNVLETAHLSSYKTQLDLVVAEGGENFSVGERQLICLARALLKKTRILILDEATASIDLDTEELIQETIRKEFFNCTILTIAHRLKTIMDSDRVLVLSNGIVVEFDKPDRLLKDPSSVFHAMVNDTKNIVHKK